MLNHYIKRVIIVQRRLQSQQYFPSILLISPFSRGKRFLIIVYGIPFGCMHCMNRSYATHSFSISSSSFCLIAETSGFALTPLVQPIGFGVYLCTCHTLLFVLRRLQAGLFSQFRVPKFSIVSHDCLHILLLLLAYLLFHY